MEKQYEISIEYCVPWNYLDRAVRAAEDILSHYQHVIVDLTFITGTSGVFDVKVNDELLFSKKQIGRHAEPGEVLDRFKEIVGPDVTVYPQ